MLLIWSPADPLLVSVTVWAGLAGAPETASWGTKVRLAGEKLALANFGGQAGAAVIMASPRMNTPFRINMIGLLLARQGDSPKFFLFTRWGKAFVRQWL
jgi:hypothetical protein